MKFTKKSKAKYRMTRKAEPRVGLALGSGSARGWAHIGVIRALADMGIEPSIVTGCSIGALVGAAYSSNQLSAFERWVRSLTWKQILGYLDFSLSGGGLIQGEKLLLFLHEHIKDVPIESLPRRFGAVATGLHSGREVWFQEGSLLEAVHASIALPGLFKPTMIDDQWLVDGGLVDPVPVSLCQAMGAEIVIAVNLNGDIVGRHSHPERSNHLELQQQDEALLWDRISTHLKSSLHGSKDRLLSQLFGENRHVPGLFEVVAGSIHIMQDRITRSRMAGNPPDITLSPRLAHVGLMEFDQAALAIDEGKACVQRMRMALEQVITI